LRAWFSGVYQIAFCLLFHAVLSAAVTNLFVVVVSSMSSASNTTAHVCPFTDITSPLDNNTCQSASVDGLLLFSFTNVFDISVLIALSHVSAVNASIAVSLSTTKVCPIASGGNTESSIFQDAFNAATPFATFFSACNMNCGAAAFGHRIKSSFTVRS
jgi:hypothetical protein